MSLYDYYCMTQTEFYYKSEGFKRIIRREWEKVRAVAYTIHIHNTDKKSRMSIEKFMPLDENKNEGLSDDFIKAYYAKKKKYQEKGWL